MEHGKKFRKFGRETKPRNALLRALAVALVDHGKIETTEAKAKSLRIFMEKLLSKGKKADLASRRLLISKLGAKAGERLLKDIIPQITQTNGGYTRIHKLNPRISDGAKMAIIELIK